ncbi:MAG: hypothetical protein V7677_18520, partial [Motiliproteus sp.]
MCEDQSPARRNNPAMESPAGSPPHAGFRSPTPVGVATEAPISGPALNGWPHQVAWSEFRSRTSRPRGGSEDAQIAVQLRPGRLSIVREN